MKISEKSLELNVGAELLGLLRGPWGLRKAYLRGLTQEEENREGVDFFVQLDPATRLFAFQFKAPRGKYESTPYRYTLVREQHELLFDLAQLSPGSVFYVFPFYVTPLKLQRDVPRLLRDTWILGVDQMPTASIFAGTYKSRTVRCDAGRALINPAYKLQRLSGMLRFRPNGIPAQKFALWYRRHLQYDGHSVAGARRNPWLVRSLRVVIATP